MNFRTDMAYNKNNFNHLYYKDNKKIEVSSFKHKNFDYRLIHFQNIFNKKLKLVLKQELNYFIQKEFKDDKYHIFIVGLGNEDNTADSIGPKSLKYIQVNSHLEKLGVNINYPKISALEPGVLGTTGINTEKIIKSIIKEIKPDIILLIDSFVCDDIRYLNQSIQITNEGITPGSGLKANNQEINKNTLNIPVIAIGIPTAMEYKDTNTFLISKSNIDEYVLNISKLIGESINELLHFA